MQAIPSENVSEVGREWQRLGGVLALIVTPCEVFSLSLVRLMMFLMISFWARLCSLLLHHIGLLYSHLRPKCLQARHEDFPSSHFFLRRRHVKHPVLERRCIFVAACFAALAVFAVPTIVADGLVTDDGAEEEDMKSSCTWGPVRWVMKAR